MKKRVKQPERPHGVASIPEVMTESDRLALETVRGLVDHMMDEHGMHRMLGHNPDECIWMDAEVGQLVSSAQMLCASLIEVYDQMQEAIDAKSIERRERMRNRRMSKN